MPVPQQRDPELTRKRLTGWLAERLPSAGEPRIAVTVPQGAGFSHESLLVDAEWTDRGRPRSTRLVVRVAPAGYRVMPVSHLDDEYAILSALAGTDVPVPAVLGHEPDPGLLGAPFYAMAHVDGWVPTDLPSYHRAGPLHDLPAGGRAAVWSNGVDVLRRLHRLDPAALGLTGLRAPAGLTAQLDFYERHLDHFDGPGAGVAVRALDVLRAALPPRPATPRLVWGDARLGNLLYSGTAVAAVLDWEMAFLGPGEADLGWYLWFDRHLSEGVGAPRLPGLPGRTETVRRYASGAAAAARETAEHLGWYELFAGFRFALIA
ncbi:phosphotransferase family protein, partial [Actinacidiphila rubida]